MDSDTAAEPPAGSAALAPQVDTQLLDFPGALEQPTAAAAPGRGADMAILDGSAAAAPPAARSDDAAAEPQPGGAPDEKEAAAPSSSAADASAAADAAAAASAAFPESAEKNDSAAAGRSLVPPDVDLADVDDEELLEMALA